MHSGNTVALGIDDCATGGSLARREHVVDMLFGILRRIATFLVTKIPALSAMDASHRFRRRSVEKTAEMNFPVGLLVGQLRLDGHRWNIFACRPCIMLGRRSGRGSGGRRSAPRHKSRGHLSPP